jgi:glycosyltransferase involved in cell wall biosynthesis
LEKHLASIIIPTYNSSAYIQEAISSALKQDGQLFEVIVIDDGSTDNTVEVLEKNASLIRIIRQENKGAASARNTGIASSKGEYLVFLDSDDLLLPGMLQSHIDFLEEHPEISLIYSDGYRFFINQQGEEIDELMTRTGEIIPISSTDRPGDLIICRNLFPMDVVTVRKDVVVAEGCFDESLSSFEDWDLWFRIVTRHPIAFLKGPVAKYRIRPGSNSKDTLRNLRDCDKVMEKIESSQAFQGCQNPDIRSEFFYIRGIVKMRLNQIDLSKKYFLKSLHQKQNLFRARLGYWIVNLLKNNAVSVYDLKRKFFGIHNTHLLR